MVDILYIGNCSIDKVVTENNPNETVYYGGSAINSALATALSNNIKVGILSSIGSDYDFNFSKYGIEFLGYTIKTDSIVFKIDEKENICVVEGDYHELGDIPSITTEHLHISFRKGVPVEKILSSNKIKYKTLSIDVMIYSVEETKRLVEKYKDEIDLIFCNASEYQYIKDIDLDNTKILITNEDKALIYVFEENSKSYSIPKLTEEEIISKTAAGDTFIGGFLRNYIKDKNIDNSVFLGISLAQESLINYGNENLDYNSIRKKYNMLINENKVYSLPKTIVVIGSSCAGKTTFANNWINKFPIYDDIDDYAPLKEVFDMDDLLRSDKRINLNKLENSLLFSKEILKEYKNDLNNINFYTSPSINGGHNIDRPILWDLILKYTIRNITDSFNIIQFSRGYDEKYEQEIGGNVYQRSINIILNNLSEELKSKILVVNMISNLDIRKERNRERYLNGGHIVAEETMNTVYKEDLIFEEIIDIPVFNIENKKKLTPIELEGYLSYNINSILKEYSKIK